MKYRVYAITNGLTATILETTDAAEAKRKYARCAREGACVRASVDGRELRIAEADRWAGMNKFFARGRSGKNAKSVIE